jgi:preprotein translocase subunit YajC
MTHQIGMLLVSFNPVIAQAQVVGGPETSAPASTQAPGGTNPPAGKQAPAGGSNIFFFFIILMVGMFLMMSMSGRKEKKKRAQMLSTLGKRDKVRTAGGIIGTIIEMKGDEVLIETDRSSHTRLLLARGSISQVLDSSKRSNDSANESTGSDVESQTEMETVSS